MIVIKRIRIKDCNVQLADVKGRERLREILKRHLGGTVDFEYEEL